MNKYQQMLIDMYLDWCNNFISLIAFADHYGITKDFATAVIKEGKILHIFDVEQQKYSKEHESTI